MKRILTLGVAWMCALAFANSTSFAKDKNEQSERVKQLEQQWAAAYLQADTATLDKIEADDYRLTDPSGINKGKTEEIHDIKAGALKFSELKFEEIKIRIYGKTALAEGVATVKGVYQGQAMNGRYRFTDVFVRKGDDWKAVASQLTIIAGK